MNFDDIVYVVCLLSCIAFGKYFRSIKDDIQRKLIGTGVGILLVCIVSGVHALHCFGSFVVCALIIINSHPSKCHIRSFVFMFGYLVFFRTTHYFGIQSPPGHTNMIQMVLTLKMVGVALEVNNAYNKIKQRSEKELSLKANDDNAATTSTEKDSTKNAYQLKDFEITEYDIDLQSLTFLDLFHYAFNYVGVLIGPYYRYRTYRDYYETPFKNFADCNTATIEKLKSGAIYCAIYLTASYIWPTEYVITDEFYEKRSILYRLFYLWPNFLVFRMRIFTGITLGECVCTYAGFGAYPNDADVTFGEGPRKQYLHLKRDAEKHKYNFDTIKNVDVYGLETCLTFRESMKHWNICIQYWLAVNVYRRFPSKKYRTLVTLFVSSFWHGFYPGHYFCLMTAPFYTPVEDIFFKYYQNYEDTGIKKRIFGGLFWLSKFFIFGYSGTAFVLLTMDKIWFFYRSIYFIGYIYYIIMAIIAYVLVKKNKSKNRQEKNKTAAAGKTNVNVVH